MHELNSSAAGKNKSRKNGAKAVKNFISALLAAVLLAAALPCAVSAAEQKEIITTFADLKTAVRAANDGDTIYVGDIDFTPPGDIDNSWMRIEADKSLTVRSGKNGGKAVFTNGSFILSAGKTADGKNTFRFENIVFDGGTDTAELSTADFDYPWSEEEQRYLSDEPEKAQHALSFRGNVDAEFTGCEFRNYMHEYGPVMEIRYGDYTATPSLLEMFGDYSACTLNLVFDHCTVACNAAFYDGGAVFINGCGNVSLTAADCVFENNYSGEGDFRIGGGAVYASGAKIVMERCRIENNSANHLFPDTELPDEDRHEGGGLCLRDSQLTLTDSCVAGNTASMGGGIAVTNTDAAIDGCVFTGNRAEEHSTNWTGDVGPWNNMAQGGAIYQSANSGSMLTVVNSSIYGNSAQNAYGGIYSYYAGNDDGTKIRTLDMKLCTYAGNTCDSEYDYAAADMIPWCSHPGDILEIPYIKAEACVIIDDTFGEDFPRYERPAAENSYNYIASPGKADDDGLAVVFPESNAHLILGTLEDADFSVPAEYAENILDGRYDGALKKVHAGCNYDAALYAAADAGGGHGRLLPLIIICAAVILAVLIFAIICIGKRRRAAAEAENAPVQPSPANGEKKDPDDSGRVIVKVWFTKDEIDSIVKSLPRAQTLTGRETEVFIEMLEGKKQKEIAYDLGIEITTVKDFCRKIYDKLDFINKEDLLKKCSELVSGK